MDERSEATFSPREVEERLGLTSATLRRYARQFAPHLSAAAQPSDIRARAHRRYTASDLTLLRSAKLLLAGGMSVEEVQRDLRRRGPGETAETAASPTPSLAALQASHRAALVAKDEALAAKDVALGVAETLTAALQAENATLRTENAHLREQVESAQAQAARLREQEQLIADLVQQRDRLLQERDRFRQGQGAPIAPEDPGPQQPASSSWWQNPFGRRRGTSDS